MKHYVVDMFNISQMVSVLFSAFSCFGHLMITFDSVNSK